MELINGLYPLEYFRLTKVDALQYPGESWWASAERYSSVDPNNQDYFLSPANGGVPSVEYMEIDLGRVREVNLVTFDVAKMPADLVIEYDALSLPSEGHRWIQAKPADGMAFEPTVSFEANARNAWSSRQFYLTDAKGDIIHTRYLRISATRRYEFWPTRTSRPFPYSIFIKNLRTGRYVTQLKHAVGPLVTANLDASIVSLEMPQTTNTVGAELRQRFVLPDDAMRGDITPSIMGFSALVQMEDPTDLDTDARSGSWKWQLLDVTGDEVILAQGVANDVVSGGQAWLNVYLDRRLQGSMLSRYELRLRSLSAHRSNTYYIQSPNALPGRRLTGTFDFTHGSSAVAYDGVNLDESLQPNDYIQIVGANTTMRVASVTSTTLTLAENFAESSVADQAVIRTESLYAPSIEGLEPLPGDVEFVNGDTTLTFDADPGEMGLTFTSPIFQATTPYVLGARIYPNQYIYEVTTAGTSAGSAPVWPTTVGATVASGSVTFTNVGPNVRHIQTGDFLRSVTPGAPLVQVASTTNGSITLTAPYIGDDEVTRANRVFSIEGDVSAPNPVRYPDRNLVMKIWGDVGDSGRDVLGNAYRYGVHHDNAERVFDGEKAGWMSGPKPSAEAVESLYFDVRDTTRSGAEKLSLIDIIKIAPRTPGVRMQVYYNQEALNGRRPESEDEWDHLMWTPVNQVYVLRKDNAIELPSTIKAAFLKLEFSNLRPMPFNLPTFPETPPVEYKRYPTWVENQFLNTKVRNAVEDFFVRSATPVQVKILETLRDPVQEFAYKEREFLASLAQGQLNSPQAVNEGLVDLGTSTYIDPVTSSNIYLGSNDQYRGNLMTSIKSNSILGQSVKNRFDPTNSVLARESTFTNQKRTVPLVSSVGSQRIAESFAYLAETPMWFNRKCRHQYKIERAQFNRKAYYVGIRSVEFSRNDYRVQHDDKIIEETYHDDAMLEANSFVSESQTTIPDGATVFVSYEVDGVTFQDEPLSLFGFENSRLLVGSDIATNIVMHSERGGQGYQYVIGTDYTSGYESDESGNLVNLIARSSLVERQIVDPSLRSGNSFRDASIVTFRYTTADFLENEDSGTVTFSFEASAVIPHEYLDADDVSFSFIAQAPPITQETLIRDDAATVAFNFFATGSETTDFLDADLVGAAPNGWVFVPTNEGLLSDDAATIVFNFAPIEDDYGSTGDVYGYSSGPMDGSLGDLSGREDLN